MRRFVLTLALVAAATPLAAQGGHQHGNADPDHAAHGNGQLPAGWQARLDRADASLGDVQFAAMQGGWHVTTGPAALFWRPQDNVAGGNSVVTATLTQTKAPMHPEAYGVFIAGGNLSGDAPEYMYFLVRGDGKYMVRHRAANGDLHTIVDWTENAAIHKADAQGKATNTLRVEAGSWGVRYLVNGTRVGEWLQANMNHALTTTGQAGLRINHNLDVHVSDFRVTRG